MLGQGKDVFESCIDFGLVDMTLGQGHDTSLVYEQWFHALCRSKMAVRDCLDADFTTLEMGP